MIDFTKPVMTKDGTPFEFLCILPDRLRASYPVYGIVGDMLSAWTKDGEGNKFSGQGFDLVQVPDPQRQKKQQSDADLLVECKQLLEKLKISMEEKWSGI